MADRKHYNPDFGSTQLKNALLHTFAGDPGSPVTAGIWYDSTLQRIGFRGTSTTYKVVRDGADLSAASVAITAVNGFDTQVRTSTLNQMAAPSADLSINTHKLTNVVDPTAAQDVATKNYVDGLVQGFSWKSAPVLVASTANVTTLSGEQTIDSVLTSASRVLLKNQTTGSQNGIYLTAAGAWSRTTDADTSAELNNATVWVSQGTVNHDSAWTQTADVPITIGTTALVWAQVGGGSGATAGNGISIVGSTVSVLADPTPADIIVSGTGVKTDPTKVAHIYTRGTIGDGSATTIVVTHGLGTQFVIPRLFLTAGTFEEVDIPIEHTSTTTVTLYFPTAPTTNQYSIAVLG